MASQRPTPQQHNIQPPVSSSSASTISPEAGRSSPSHSAYSEDSQTVILNTPLPEESSSRNKNQPTQTRESSQALAVDEPRKCWICFSDETEDSPTSSEWRSPCPCALTAHESCLLDWVADREKPQKSGSSRRQIIECPQCKAEIRIARPHSQVVEAYQRIQDVAGRLFWPGIIGSLVSGMGAACVLHGASSVYLLLGTYDAEILLGVRNGRMPSSNCLLGLASIPGVLMLSSTSFADSLLPILPIFLIAGHRPTRQAGRLWPPSAAMTLATLPYIRAAYNGLRRQAFLEREKIWDRQIQPRNGEDGVNAEDGAANDQHIQNEQPGDNNEAGGLNFEIGVELEIVDEEEVPAEDEQRQEADHLEVVPNQGDQVQNPRQNHNEGPDAAIGDQANQGGNNDANQNQPQPAPPVPNPAPLAEQHRVIRLVPLVSAIVHTMIGALAFPAVAAGMGGLMSLFLPWTWKTPPGRWDYRSPGLLQSRFGRSVVGGCLFLVLKDTLSLYSKYRLAEDHLHRRVLDYDGKNKKSSTSR
ncbi:MAG: hypothetical protein Q9204_000771 [Flavoplaca sp. TL-2023a]